MTAWSAAAVNGLQSRAPLCVLAQVDHPLGMLYYWTGLGPLSWNGQTWQGVGLLASIEAAQRSTSLAIQEIKMTLSGLPADQASLISSQVRMRTARAWLAVLTPEMRVVADPILLFEATMDYQTLSIAENGTASVAVIAQAGFWTLERAVDVSWSNEEQQRAYAGDTGMDRIPGLVDRELAWTIS